MLRLIFGIACGSSFGTAQNLQKAISYILLQLGQNCKRVSYFFASVQKFLLKKDG
jgi:hypothetical protein